MAQMLHARYTHDLAVVLRRRGVRALPAPSNLVFLFTDEGGAHGGQRVATALRFRVAHTSGAVVGVDTAFTRGELGLSDNFDFEDGQTIPVEIPTFGACKAFVEAHEIGSFINKWSDAEVRSTLKGFAALELGRGATPDAPELAPLFGPLLHGASTPADRLAFLGELTRRHFLDVDREVLAYGKKKGYTQDPVYIACKAREPELAERAATRLNNSPEDTIAEYIDARKELLPALLHGNPRFAKLAVGRKVLFPLIDTLWGAPHTDLSAWSVFFARRFMLARHPTLAYGFLMMQRGGVHSETSDCDDLWAVQIAPPTKDASPLDWLQQLAPGEESERYWDDIRSKAPTRKLGVVNARVAQSLLGALSPEDEAAAQRAQDWLARIGWGEWFDRAVVPLCGGGGSVFAPPDLPRDLVDAVARSDATSIYRFARGLAGYLRV